MERKFSEKEQASIDAYKMFSSPEGMIVLNDLENYCSFGKTTKDVKANVDEMIFKEGKRSVFLHIKKKLAKAEINIYDLLK